MTSIQTKASMSVTLLLPMKKMAVQMLLDLVSKYCELFLVIKILSIDKFCFV